MPQYLLLKQLGQILLVLSSKLAVVGYTIFTAAVCKETTRSKQKDMCVEFAGVCCSVPVYATGATLYNNACIVSAS